MPDNDSFPIPEGTPPPELRGSATVVKRAAKLKRKLGYDPLDPEVIERARERKRQWAKLLSRQVALAVLSGAVTILLLAHHLVGVVGERPVDGDDFALLLGVTVIVFLVCGLSVIKIVAIVRHRHAELGHFFAAHRELDELYRRGS
ncbi:hypothetical protein H0B56_01345 [Haloechinothrix sp. YIM 98757]|uniref:Uncharacterized protein n=1 Tax=Haloechinothrix aidingensis TaxID=2752311 RepID=A0A837ZZD7_9PSEU|nr:hypothetical protein [Haloechinothrix aidingensis]MBA0124183.1 hypothetical protein [Haloechinothrix aidingensis]